MPAALRTVPPRRPPGPRHRGLRAPPGGALRGRRHEGGGGRRAGAPRARARGARVRPGPRGVALADDRWGARRDRREPVHRGRRIRATVRRVIRGAVADARDHGPLRRRAQAPCRERDHACGPLRRPRPAGPRARAKPRLGAQGRVCDGGEGLARPRSDAPPRRRLRARLQGSPRLPARRRPAHADPRVARSVVRARSAARDDIGDLGKRRRRHAHRVRRRDLLPRSLLVRLDAKRRPLPRRSRRRRRLRA